MNTEIRFGMPVMTSDGKRIGKVDRLVVDPDHLQFLEVVVQQYLPIPVERIVNRVDIHRVDNEALLLKIDHEAAHMLPQFNTREYSVASTDGGGTPFALGAGPTTNQPILYERGSSRHEMHAARTNVFEAAVATASVVEVRSNLPDAAVVLNRGTDVLDADEHKIGTLDEMSFDERGTITGFVIRTGFFTRHEQTVLAERIAAITHKYVRLNVKPHENGTELAEMKRVLPAMGGVDDAYAARLRDLHILSSQDLLEKGATRKGRQEIAETTGIPVKLILKWVNHADLLRVPGVGDEYAVLLEESGVDTVPELATRSAENLYATLREVNAERAIVKTLPAPDEVSDWIQQARSLQRLIEY
jgi:predicted flap endonuclease-1-like 5' DNA nuclease